MLVLMYLSPTIQAQDTYSDSLKGLLIQDIHDTAKVNILIELGKNHLGTDNGLALEYIEDAKERARISNFGSGLAYAYKYSGIVYYYQGQLREAMEEWQTSLQIFDSTENKLGMANILNNIGAVYYDQGELTQALENYLQSLKISQQIGDDLRTATAMVNVGTVYMDNPATRKLALEYYLKALALSETLDDMRTIGNVSLNIGEIYLAEANDTLAEKYIQKALDNVKETDLEPSALMGLSRVESQRKNYTKSLAYLQEAYKKAAKNDFLLYAAQALTSQADLLAIMGDNELALENYKKAIPLANAMGANKELRYIYTGLNKIYAASARYDSAFKYLNLLVDIKDTLFNEATDKRLAVLRLDFELEKKEGEIIQLTTVNELSAKVIQRQKIIRNLIIAGLISILIFLYVALRQKRRIAKEKQRSEELLLNILPADIAEELKTKGYSDARNFSEVTVLFTDFMDFTSVSEVLGPQELVLELNIYFKTFDEIITRHGIEKIKTIGDAYMAAGGVPKEKKGSITSVINAALEMQSFVQDRQKLMQVDQSHYFKMRVGIHTGSVVAGIVGVKKFQYDIWGDTVNTASRMESCGEAGKVNISQSTYLLLNNNPAYAYENRGKVEVKGKGEIEMWFIEHASEADA